jgi:hypothetical protein
VATFSTADAAGTLSSTIFWGDGTSSAGTVTAVGTVSGLTQYDVLGTHTYADETRPGATNSVVVQVNDTTDATVAFINSKAAVADAPLSPFATSTIANSEGVAINPTTATFTDANTGATAADFAARIDWGDGTSPSVGVVAATATPGRFTVSAGHTYPANGNYPVTTTITDRGGSTLVFVNQATVTDAALTLGPTLALSTTEGQPLSNQIVGTFTDADAFGVAGSFSARIDWGDGTPNTPGTVTKLGNSGGGAVFAITGSHTYTTVGTPTISVAVTDSGGSTIGSSTSAAVSVAQAPIQLTVSPLVATEQAATPANFMVATFIDTGGADVGYTGTVDFGDGSGPVAATVVPLGGDTFGVQAPSHTYKAPGQYPLTVSVTDPDPTTVSGSAVAFVAPAALTSAAGANAVPPLAAIEGAALSNVPVAAFNDPDLTATAASFTATINWGDGLVTPGTVTATATPGLFTVSGTHTFAGVGAYPIRVVVQDTGGGGVTLSNAATVGDAALTLGAPLSLTYLQNQPSGGRLVGTFTDANPSGKVSDFTATIDWGDLTPATQGVIALIGGSASGAVLGIYGDHTYAASGTDMIKVSVSDAGGSSIAPTVSATATVAPALTSPDVITVTALPAAATEGMSTATGKVVATFIDRNGPQPIGNYAATIDWGDGTTSPGTVASLGGGQFSVQAPAHTFAKVGTSVVTVSVTAGAISGLSAGQVTVADAPLSAQPASSLGGPEGALLTGLVVATFTDANPNALASDFKATIDWGDGSPPTQGTIASLSGGFEVLGTHEYADARVNGGSNTFPVTVTIHDAGGSVARVVSGAVIHDTPIPLAGALDPSSDHGTSNVDAVTNVNRPRFFGTTEPYATVVLMSVSLATAAPAVIGQTQADGSGAWALTANLIPDGRYAITAVAVDRAGFSTAVTPVLPNAKQGPLVVDTAAPVVADVRFGQTTGQILVTFQGDAAGLDPASVLDPAYYHVLLRNVPVGVLRVAAVPAPSGSSANSMTVVVTINNGRPLPAGNYLFSIDPGGVRDVAGNGLDGAFYGTFPSGNHQPGSAFTALFNTRSRRILPTQSAIGPASSIHARAVQSGVAHPDAAVARRLTRPQVRRP